MSIVLWVSAIEIYLLIQLIRIMELDDSIWLMEILTPNYGVLGGMELHKSNHGTP